MNYGMMADELFSIFEDSFKKYWRKMEREYMSPENLVLMKLARSEDGIVYAGTLSSYIAVATSRMAVILNQLGKDGMIERRIDEDDSRKRIVVATDKGRRRGVELLDEMREKCAKLLEGLGEEDALKYIDLQRKMVEVAEKNVD